MRPVRGRPVRTLDAHGCSMYSLATASVGCAGGDTCGRPRESCFWGVDKYRRTECAGKGEGSAVGWQPAGVPLLCLKRAATKPGDLCSVDASGVRCSVPSQAASQAGEGASETT